MRTNKYFRRGILLAAAVTCLFWVKGENASAAAEPVIVNQEPVVYLDGTDQISTGRGNPVGFLFFQQEKNCENQ